MQGRVLSEEVGEGVRAAGKEAGTGFSSFYSSFT